MSVVDRRDWTAVRDDARPALPSWLVRLTFVGLMIGVVTFTVASADAGLSAKAVAAAGDDLTRLLRFMAGIKAVLALAAAGAVVWRLSTPASLAWFAAYCVAGGAMVAGPGLIWAMVHVALGALLLHGGLVATILLCWNDPAMAARLAAMVRADGRRSALNRLAGGARQRR